MSTAIFWFRRDLRLEDNHGLFQALSHHQEIIPLFIFDEAILSKLKCKKDLRLSFIYQNLKVIDEKIKLAGGSGLVVLHGDTKQCWQEVLNNYTPSSIYCNHDYEPYATKRDLEIEWLASDRKVSFESFKDQVIFEENEVMKADGTPYTVFTPYSKVWKSHLSPENLNSYPSENFLENFTKRPLPPFPLLDTMGFEQVVFPFPSTNTNKAAIARYDQVRDIPALDATSHQSVHLRFGTISIRKLVNEALKLNETFLNELIWREFFMMILYHFPESANAEFKSKYSGIKWRYDEEDFKKWCFGQTGYPIVDAGMRELNKTGFMHNRVRMITASFLVKHLLIDWRWGERYFASKLLDYDLSANVGNWQWAAGTGCDAAPYFRIFNPYTQTENFDKDMAYVKKWVPEYDSSSYPQAMVEHKFARERALRVYKEGLKE
jgi:deoxyribodipyrimidine photo-lyase